MIKTYGHYLRETQHKPGEHHFITVYLIPRLRRCAFLRRKVPTWISPDGSKGQWGDVVYGSSDSSDLPKLSIEVKISYSKSSIGFTAGQYNLQISKARKRHQKYNGVPDLLLAAVPSGIAIVPWEAFRLQYLKTVYPGKGPPAHREGRNALSFRHENFAWCSESFVELPAEQLLWKKAEQKFVCALEVACRKVWER